jgi:hypothetical protein
MKLHYVKLAINPTNGNKILFSDDKQLPKGYVNAGEMSLEPIKDEKPLAYFYVDGDGFPAACFDKKEIPKFRSIVTKLYMPTNGVSYDNFLQELGLEDDE